MTFPANVGYPLGEGENAGKQLYYMLEIHYDNPDEVAGLKFKTGVQFYYTDEIRYTMQYFWSIMILLG